MHLCDVYFLMYFFVFYFLYLAVSQFHICRFGPPWTIIMSHIKTQMLSYPVSSGLYLQYKCSMVVELLCSRYPSPSLFSTDQSRATIAPVCPLHLPIGCEFLPSLDMRIITMVLSEHPIATMSSSEEEEEKSIIIKWDKYMILAM